MIDCHCHLEQPDYARDREKVIERCKKELKAVITCCAHPKDFDLTLNLVKKYPGFIFATFSIHPEYVEKISQDEVERYFKLLKENEHFVCGIGETGLDFWEVEEVELRKRQEELFIKFIKLASELKKPLIVHARKAFDEAVEILQNFSVSKVLMHFFSARHLLKKVIDNGWLISVNTMVLRSKKIKKVVRDMPLERILLESDSPWLGSEGRNEPLAVKIVAEKIAEMKKIKIEDVDRITTKNSIEFFKLPFSFP